MMYSTKSIVDYPSALKFLYSLNARINKKGVSAPSYQSLEIVATLYKKLGKPLDKIPIVHIGGTNGKGSTCYKLAQGIQSLGVRCGLFVSPHISSFRERIQINGVMITEDELLESLVDVIHICDTSKVCLTSFEIVFLMSCLHYRKQSCDACVLEVGVGGKWDATNVVSSTLSIICSVGLDHTQFLGDSLEKIAIQKCGIFKEGCPALVGPSCPVAVMKNEAFKLGANLHTLGEYLHSHPTLVPLQHARKHMEDELGNPDIVNSALALCGINILLTELLNKQLSYSGSFSFLSKPLFKLAEATSSARWEVLERKYEMECKEMPVSITFILDVAHNADAISNLVRRLQATPRMTPHNTRVLFGMCRDKDVRVCLSHLTSFFPPSRIHFVESQYYRSLSKSQLQKTLEEVIGASVASTYCGAGYQLDSAISALSEVLKETKRDIAVSPNEGAYSSENFILVCGTTHIMPFVKAELGVIEPNDAIYLTGDRLIK